MPGHDEEVRELAAALRAHAAWEAELSGGGWPEVEAPAPGSRVAPAQAPVVVPTGERRLVLAGLAEQAASCTRCGLHGSRTKSVFSRGNPEARLVFVGDGPGSEEDALGEPFVGAAGQLLDKMIVAMGFARDAVYVCNLVKCRAPRDREPTPDEVAACAPFLVAQLDAVRPEALVALGRVASLALGAPASKVWRGVWSEWRGVPVMSTYHPADVLASAELKRPVWQDLQAVMAKLGMSR